MIDCQLVSQRYEISECNINNNQCKLNINNVYISSQCPNSNLTRIYWQIVTLLHKDIITFINVTNNNNTYIIPDYIHNITIRDSGNSSTDCYVPNYYPFSEKNLCQDFQFYDSDWSLYWVLGGVVFAFIALGSLISFSWAYRHIEDICMPCLSYVVLYDIMKLFFMCVCVCVCLFVCFMFAKGLHQLLALFVCLFVFFLMRYCAENRKKKTQKLHTTHTRHRKHKTNRCYYFCRRCCCYCYKEWEMTIEEINYEYEMNKFVSENEIIHCKYNNYNNDKICEHILNAMIRECNIQISFNFMHEQLYEYVGNQPSLMNADLLPYKHYTDYDSILSRHYTNISFKFLFFFCFFVFVLLRKI